MVSGQKYLLVLIIFVFVTNLAASNAGLVENDTLYQNTRENRQLKRDAQKEELRKSHNRFIFTTAYVYAWLITEASFELPGGWLTAKVSLEENLGLPGRRGFFTGGFIYRASPRSGLYLGHYGINRSKTYQTNRDQIHHFQLEACNSKSHQHIPQRSM